MNMQSNATAKKTTESAVYSFYRHRSEIRKDQNAVFGFDPGVSFVEADCSVAKARGLS